MIETPEQEVCTSTTVSSASSGNFQAFVDTMPPTVSTDVSEINEHYQDIQNEILQDTERVNHLYAQSFDLGHNSVSSVSQSRTSSNTSIHANQFQLDSVAPQCNSYSYYDIHCCMSDNNIQSHPMNLQEIPLDRIHENVVNDMTRQFTSLQTESNVSETLHRRDSQFSSTTSIPSLEALALITIARHPSVLSSQALAWLTEPQCLALAHALIQSWKMTPQLILKFRKTHYTAVIELLEAFDVLAGYLGPSDAEPDCAPQRE